MQPNIKCHFTIRIIILLIVLFGTVGVLIPDSRYAEAQGRKPRRVFIPPIPTAAESANYFSNVIVVKFQEGSSVRLRNGQLQIQAMQASPALAPVQTLLASQPGNRVERLFTSSEADLDQERQRALARSSEELADLNLYYRVILPDNTTFAMRQQFVRDLLKQPLVEVAYMEPIPHVAGGTDISPTTNSFRNQQGYLDAAPRGMAAFAAWQQPGGRGANVRIVDIEAGWYLNHEDLPTSSESLIDGCNRSDCALQAWDPMHGTAVLGIIGGIPNDYGITGVSSDAYLRVASYIPDGQGPNTVSNVADTIRMVAQSLYTREGDIILIELMGKPTNPEVIPIGTTCECNCAQFGYLPMEYWPAIYDEIKAATLSGRIIVEAAGNGSMNLDDPVFEGHFDPITHNSGAILVGAGTPDSHDAECFTNYGSRIDLQGWGSNIVTTGRGSNSDLFNGNGDVNQYYTSSFGGTSGASPMIVGAAAVLQGISRQRNTILTASDIIHILSNTGTPQGSNTHVSKPIGAFPNLAQAIQALPITSPCNLSNTLIRVSRSANCVEGNAPSIEPIISGNGRYIAFSSSANNLVPDDTNNVMDIFVYDTVLGTISRASVSSSGEQGDDYSRYPSLSADGRYVVFESMANNFSNNDADACDNNPGCDDIFVHDMVTGETRLVSHNMLGGPENRPSWSATISSNGRFVTFDSYASNLVLFDTNLSADGFIYDMITGQITRVTIDTNNEQIWGYSLVRSISDDGRFVSFDTDANLFLGDANYTRDSFLRDLQTGVTERVPLPDLDTSLHATGAKLTANARYVSYMVMYGLTYRLYLWDRETGDIRPASVSTGGIEAEIVCDYSVSSDGRFVLFASPAYYLARNDLNNTYDIFAHDMTTGKTTRLSISELGEEGNFSSCTYGQTISADGSSATFYSAADNLVPNDGNNVYDIFVSKIQFPVQPPEASIQWSPQGGLTTAPSEFWWYLQPDSRWYYLWIQGESGVIHAKWYTSNDASCFPPSFYGSFCRVTIPETLTNGSYKWWVQTYNIDGYGPWSSGMDFTVYGQIPDATVLVHPSGITAATTPAFVWQKAKNAQWYYLWVSGPNGKVIDQWYDGWNICSGDTCSVTPPLNLTNGTYTFWVQTWGGNVYGPWSDGKQFTVTGQTPGTVTLLAPNGAISETNPTFRWTDDPNAQWYYLWVSDATTNTKVIDQWYDRYGGIVTCNIGQCALSPTLNLIPGHSYQFWVQTWGGGTYGSWSSGMQFAVNNPSPKLAPTFMPK